MRTIESKLGPFEPAVFVPETPDDLAPFRAVFPPGGLYGLDVEGTYLSDLAQFDPEFRLRKVQFATYGYAWVLDVGDPDQRAAAVGLLSDQTCSFVSHTNMDVLSVFVRLGVDITGRNVDTRMLASMADPDMDRSRDLKTLTSEHIGPELAKAEAELSAHFRDIWPGRKNAKKADIDRHGWATVAGDHPGYLKYAGLDAVAAVRLAPVLVSASRAPAALLRKETWLATQANRIQLRGMLVDRPALDELAGEAVRETSGAEAVIAELTGGIKARSPKIIDWLGQHGCNWIYWQGALTETGNVSLAKDNVKLLFDYPLDDPGVKVATELVRFKAHQDSLNKTKGILAHLAPDGRVHPSLNTLGAVTARMSSAGPNFQNFSKRDPRHRGLFVFEPGTVGVTIDFDQVELRVVAALAGEEKMIETILAGGDLHQLTVDEIAEGGITIDRDAAKIVNFLIVYGGGARALHEQTGIPPDLAGQIIATWRSRYEAITAYAQRMGSYTEEIRTIAHRRLPVTVNKRTGDKRAYANINYAVQNAARELLVDAWWRLASATPTGFGRASLVWYPIHDELVLQVPEDLVETVIAEAQQCMRFDFMGVPISASAVVLRDEQGESRWMTSKRAEKIAQQLSGAVT